MSRCFPFPPPGYEKKATPDDINLIIKEKHKQKKHKDKRDKDKKEKSERKVKERSEGKDKKDKERKEKKHKDKKDKDGKRKLLEEKKTEGSYDNQNAEKLCTGSKTNDQIQDSKILVELGKRVRDESGATGSQTVHKKIILEQKNGLVGNLSRENPNKVENGSRQVLAGSHMVEKNIPMGQKNGLVGIFSRENPNKVEAGSRQGHASNQMVQKNILVGQKNGLVGNVYQEKPNKLEGGSRQLHAGNQMVQKNNLVGQKNGLVGNVYQEKPNKLEGGPRQEHANNQMVQKNIIVGQKNGLVGNLTRENQNKVERGSRQVQADSQMVQKNILVGQKNGFVESFYGDNLNKVDGGSLQDSRMVQKNNPVEHTDDGLVGNINGENQNKVGGGSHKVDGVEKGKEGGKEKKKRKSSDGKGDGHKNKDRDKKAEEKKRKKEKKEKKKEEKKRRESGGNFPDICENKSLDLRHDSQGDIPKHKEHLLNGFVHDHGIQPNNLSRPASSSQPGQNGSDFDPSQKMSNLAVEKGGVITNHKVKGKVSSSQSVINNVMNVEPGRSANNFTADHGRPVISNHLESNGPISSDLVSIDKKIELHQTKSNMAKPNNNVKVPSLNPVVENRRKMGQPVIDKAAERRVPDNKNGVGEDKPCTSSRASSATVKADKKVDTYKKPPHPDTKYLGQIYSVPPQVEWPQFDDQEWLFGCEDSRAKRAKLGPSEIESPKQVWAEAMQLESADVIALPYVVPY